MSILIRGMHSPERCDCCAFARFYEVNGRVWCNAANVIIEDQWDGKSIPRAAGCPIVEVSELYSIEQFTDIEQRIFLSAMYKEEKVCKKVDDECRQYQEECADDAIILVDICHEIMRKVKGALWRNRRAKHE